MPTTGIAFACSPCGCPSLRLLPPALTFYRCPCVPVATLCSLRGAAGSAVGRSSPSFQLHRGAAPLRAAPLPAPARTKAGSGGSCRPRPPPEAGAGGGMLQRRRPLAPFAAKCKCLHLPAPLYRPANRWRRWCTPSACPSRVVPRRTTKRLLCPSCGCCQPQGSASRLSAGACPGAAFSICRPRQ